MSWRFGSIWGSTRNAHFDGLLSKPDTHFYFFHSLRPLGHRRGRPIVHKDIIEKERKRDIIIIRKICGEEAAA